MDYGDSICDDPDCLHPFSFHGIYGCYSALQNPLKSSCPCRRDPNKLRGSALHERVKKCLEVLGYPEIDGPEQGIHQQAQTGIHHQDPADYDPIDIEESDEPYIPRIATETLTTRFVRAIDLL